MRQAYCTMDLNGTWQLARFPVGQGTPELAKQAEAIPCAVPGDIHNALLNSGEIADPLLGNQIERLRDYEKMEWWYRRDIMLLVKQLDVRYYLHFDGIDLNGRVYLNGQFLGIAENAFSTYEYDVSDVLQIGCNSLLVVVDCGLYTICAGKEKEIDRHNAHDPSNEGSDLDWRRLYLRKAQFVYEWDWAKRLVTTGLWRGVELRQYRGAVLRDLYVKDMFHEDGSVTLCLQAQVETMNATSAPEVVLSVDGFGETWQARTTLEMDGLAQASFTLPNPRLWYPNGYGEQALYTVSARVYVAEHIVSTGSHKHGVRKLELDETYLNEEEGNRFALRINGKDIFCKGANWVPTDSILANENEKTFQALLSAAKDAHYTMLRVWGGGIYENPRFYELCDEYGITLWHDFIFSNGYYPDDDPTFLENVRRELVKAIHDLRTHASLAIWCGNNEIDWQHQELQSRIEQFFGRHIYHELLPELLEEFDGTRPYRPSSPYGFTPGDVGSRYDGDSHSWYFWLGNSENVCNRDQFLDDKAKFSTEYGVMSYPNYCSMHQYLCGNVSPHNPAWETHNNLQEANHIDDMLKRYYLQDTTQLDIHTLVHFSQYMQGDTYRLTMEHFIRRAPYCMGVLYWMFNDCWGCTSWTCIDYYLRKKASWDIVKRSYSPVMGSLLYREEGMDVYVVQTTIQTLKNLQVTYGIYDLDGRNLLQNRQTIDDLAPMSGQLIETISIKELPEGTDINELYAYIHIMDEQGITRYHNYSFLTSYKNVRLQSATVEAELLEYGAQTKIRLTADQYAVNVFLQADETEFNDNAFDLAPGEQRVIIADKSVVPENLSIDILNGQVNVKVYF